jgi:hypothetical protein
MSLIVTSSNPSDDQLLTGGLNLPYSYTNNLNDPLKIPPESQIAVQSVKINKNGLFQLSLSNSVFGFYFGDELEETQTFNDSNSIVMSHACIDADENTRLTGLPDEIAGFAQRAGNRCLFHPNLLETTDPNINQGLTCDVKRNASDLGFDGFKFTVTNPTSACNVNQVTNMVEAKWKAAAGGEDDATYDSTDGELANLGDDPDVFIYQDLPLSLCNGSFTVKNFIQESRQYRIGLSRCTRAEDLDGNYPADEFQFPPYFDGGSATNTNPQLTTFYDYLVEIEPNASGTIKVYHAISNKNSGGDKLVLTEFDYTQNACGTGTGGVFNAKEDDIEKISFNIQNERVKITLENGSGTKFVLCNGTNVDSGKNLKPINMCTRFLYPKIELPAGADNSLALETYHGVDIKNFVFGDQTLLASGEIVNSFQDFYAYMVNDGKWASLKSIDIERKKATDFTNQLGMASNRINNKGLMFFAPDSVFKFFTQNCNSRRIFGFTYRPKAVPTNTYTTGNLIEFISDEPPALKNTESYFIRLKNMTFESTNFAIGQKSKILYHLPSFSNNGESTGALYFEPTSIPVYVDLQNTTEIMMNSIEVDIVKTDESLATLLTGRTTVIFHIRPRPK